MDGLENKLQALGEHLGSGRERIRYAAAYQLHALGIEAFEFLLQLTYHANPLVRAMACNVIRDLYEQGGIDLSLRAAAQFFQTDHYRASIDRFVHLARHDPQRGVRQAALLALGRWQDEGAIPVICDASTDRSAIVREGAATALGNYTDEYWDTFPNDVYYSLVQATLTALIQDKDADVRNWAIPAIRRGGYWSLSIEDILLRALDDSFRDVRGEAAWTLACRAAIGFKDRFMAQLIRDPAPSYYLFHAAVELADPSILPALHACIDLWREKATRFELRSYRGYADRAIAVLEGKISAEDYVSPPGAG